MNEGNSQFIIMAIIIGGFCIYSFYGWYRRKENQKLKATGFQDIAAGNNLDYKEKGKNYLSQLVMWELVPGKEAKVKNIMTRQHSSFITRVFDASYMVGIGKRKRAEYLIGLAIEFEDMNIPHFNLAATGILDGVTLLSNMQKIKKETTPTWLKKGHSLFYGKQSMPDDVINLFQDREDLSHLIDRTDFHSLAGNGKTFVYYLNGETEPTLEFFNEMDEIGALLQNSLGCHMTK